LEDALGAVREKWEPKSTADNLALIQHARSERGQGSEWLGDVIAALVKKAAP
jgi:hypothetical protein